MTGIKTVFLAVALLAPPFAQLRAAPQDREAGAPVVDLFKKICLSGARDAAQIGATVEASGEWRSIPLPANFDVDTDYAKAWAATFSGRAFELLLTRRPKYKKHANGCVLRTLARENMFPYLDPLNRALKASNLRGREIDLPHYYRASGKLPDGRAAEFKLTTQTPSSSSNYTTFFLTF